MVFSFDKRCGSQTIEHTEVDAPCLSTTKSLLSKHEQARSQGLTNTGRVSIKRTQAAATLIQKSAAKKNVHRSQAGETLVTARRTATGKQVVAFRVVGNHGRLAGRTESVESRSVAHDQA